MSFVKFSALCGLIFVMALCSVPAAAQITFLDFSTTDGLALNGSAAQTTNATGQPVLRLTPDTPSHNGGSAWFTTQQSIASGFTSVFQFQITHDPNNPYPGPADGLAFVVQNSVNPVASGTQALGGSGGAIGYGVPDPGGDTGTPIDNSLAVEIDTFKNSWDPDANHIAIQSCGPDNNTQDHTALCPNGSPSELGIISNPSGINLADGNVHTLVVDYDPGTLRIYLDNFGVPVLTIPVNLATLLNLNSTDSGQTALVGFTGATGYYLENNDILSWTFTPATVPTPITQTLVANNPNPTDTNYVFGSYNHKIEYSLAAESDEVTVTAIPTDPSAFSAQRLAGTPYQNASCVVFQGTGGQCVVFSVQCTGGADCSNLNYTLFNNFNTDQTITGACLLKTDPIGSNNWVNIIESFTQTRQDPGSKSGSIGFSDFVLAQNCTALPGINITSPANNAVYVVGQSVPIQFSCSPDPNAQFVTITSCTATLNGNAVINGSSYTPTAPGPLSLVVTAADSVQDSNTKTSNASAGTVPVFTSSGPAVFTVGTFGSFLITTTVTPVAALSAGGELPNGLGFLDNGNGTATISGTPAAGTGGNYNVTISANNGAGTATQILGVTVNQGPAITSGNATTFSTGVLGSFTVTATGSPVPAISYTGSLPNGVMLVDNHNGTGTLSGTPAAGTGGVYSIVISANNGVGTPASQAFTLTVYQSPVITSANSATFGAGVNSSFTVTATGYPSPAITESGALPSGIHFTAGTGTATLSGSTTAVGTYPISFTASSSAGSVTQSFTLVISGPQALVSPTSINFGSVQLGSSVQQIVTLTNTGTGTLQISKVALNLGKGTDGDDFSVKNGCPGSLSAGQSCSIKVIYSPDDAGNQSATLVISDNAPGGKQQVSITGTGVKKHR